jgi:hypothetical protein
MAGPDKGVQQQQQEVDHGPVKRGPNGPSRTEEKARQKKQLDEGEGDERICVTVLRVVKPEQTVE